MKKNRGKKETDGKQSKKVALATTDKKADF